MESSDDSNSEKGAADVLNQFVAIKPTQRPKEERSDDEDRLLCVAISKSNCEDEFKYLPGHSYVKEILSKLNDDAFLVELESGDSIQISYNNLLEFSGGSAALRKFKNSIARPQRSLRRGIRPPTDGFVDIETLSLSSDDDQNGTPDESTDSSASIAPRMRRSRRLISKPTHNYGFPTEDDSDELNSPVTFRSGRYSSRGKGLRTSERLKGTSAKRMVELTESDLPEIETSKSVSKYHGAREIFDKTLSSSQFRLQHQPICASCSRGENFGRLVPCQGCTDSYHQACLGYRNQRLHLVTKINTGYFILQCRHCLGVANSKDPLVPHLGKCTQCHDTGFFSKPLRPQLTSRQEQMLREENGGIDPITNVDMDMVNNPENVMFRCTTCKRSWHKSHLSTMDPNTLQCEECENAPGEIESLVAWRPLDLDSYTPGYTSDMLPEESKEYLVKWRKLSFFKVKWMPGPWVWSVTAAVMRKAFNKSTKSLKPCMTTEDATPEEFLHMDIALDIRYSNVVSNRTRDIDLARIKEVKEVYAKFKGLPYEDAVWERPPDASDTDRWHSFQAAYNEWVEGNYLAPPNPTQLKHRLSAARSLNFGQSLVKRSQPSILTGGQLMPYQQEGLNWIYFMWFQQKNAILADEMGLGKTIQVIAFFATLVQDHSCWPFLVVVPNSTVPNWRSEIKRWAPSLRVVTYYGLSTARKLAHDYEMFPGGTEKSGLRCHVVVTSYETVVDSHARRVFSSVQWQGLVVDEGHRLKNDKSLFYETISKMKFPFKLLLTGTPLQNNIRELFNVIQFCDPSKDANVLEKQYRDLNKDNVNELHEMIRPFFLRRTKAQVLTFLLPMAQIIVPLSMTIVQKKLYRSILAKNPQLIKAIFNKNDGQRLKSSERHNLNNLLVQLRKCLCHPFVYSKAIEERDVSATLLYRNLIEASSKLQFLELLLPKLQERGHRVLIFCQFLDFLDIIEDFLDGIGVLHLRLDGSITSLQKQKRIDLFNAPNSPYFAFLLSTRAGGVGINLATADTVVIMDPDFNPHQDIQALSRAHRIGQQKKVLVFQLMTRGSAEEKIMQIGRKKMALDHVLIERMDAEEDAGDDLESILRYGAEALFDDNDRADVRYDTESIEKLLDRSEIENTRTGDDSSAESQFGFARVWTNENANFEEQLSESESTTLSSTVWEKILKERENLAKEEALSKAEALGRGKRKRQTVDYTVPQSRRAEHASDTDFTATDVTSDVEEEPASPLEQPSKPPRRKRGPSHKSATSALARLYKRARLPESAPSSMQYQPCIACGIGHPQGYCRLKQAGVEHCGLCGIAHFGYSRTCPHLNSESQVASMLSSLKESTEQRALVENATKYLRGIRGDLVRRKKIKAGKLQEATSTNKNLSQHPYAQPSAPIPSAVAGPSGAQLARYPGVVAPPYPATAPYPPYPLNLPYPPYPAYASYAPYPSRPPPHFNPPPPPPPPPTTR
ncbi:hypothetical protein LOZ51_005382 [Ophidiomyces ophidiicola]|nr:hypothetical protein LOZ55_003080 [Ophidiomyces ophidiicola]KAI1988565.1 hypothetical protein LOZ51_005382 [Ophidiomyces ophidiicola]KAI1989608.1 hypothetical protein LOZ54_002810 [Ophidiomyces ophidiicola]